MTAIDLGSTVSEPEEPQVRQIAQVCLKDFLSIMGDGVPRGVHQRLP